MDLEQRDQLLASIADAESRKATLGAIDDDWEAFELAEKKRLESLDDEALRAELLDTLAEWQRSDRLNRLCKVTRNVFAERRNWFSATVGEARNALERDPPPMLAAAIKRMEQALEFARSLGTTQRSFSQTPGGSTFLSSKGRTAEDEKATERIERALNKMRNLAFVKGDLPQLIAAVVKEADIGAIWTGLPTEPPPPNTFDARRDKLKRESIADGVFAEIEPDKTPRERLSPAG